MKSKETKRLEAMGRTMNAVYANSRAARKGVSEEVWQKDHKARVEHLMVLTGVRTVK